MSVKRQKYDTKAPGTKARIDEIFHGGFMREGTMVAFPACFPGATTPIPADESRITALAAAPDGYIYGATSGRAAHVFVAMFPGVTGAIFDRGLIEGADRSVAIGCGKSRFAVCANGPAGGRVIGGGFEGTPFDLIQEWGFGRGAFREIGRCEDKPIVHAVTDPATGTMIGATADRLFAVDVEKSTFEIVGQAPVRGRLAIGSGGGVFGLDGATHLWRYDPAARRIERKAVRLPAGEWEQASPAWARSRRNGLLYLTDSRGTLFSFDETHGFSPALGQIPHAPVGPMAVTDDGRLFGFSGEGIARMFRYQPGDRTLADLGVAVSTIERRRYGYAFGAAVTGRDGQIVFGEDDDLGHLWLYFPKIIPAA
jgi:hypothetical protein